MTLEDITKNQPDEIRDIFYLLRSMVLQISPLIEEEFLGGSKVKMSSYSINKMMICVISPATDHCKFYLHHTDHVDTGILKLEGRGKHARTVRIAKTNPELLRDIERTLRNILSHLSSD